MPALVLQQSELRTSGARTFPDLQTYLVIFCGAKNSSAMLSLPPWPLEYLRRRTAVHYFMLHKRAQLPVVLSIAGHDPSSGAGITADVKTMAANGCYGVTCITALTVQSTRGVKRIDPVEGRIITETLEHLMDDMQIAAVKIGMLGSAEAAKCCCGFSKTLLSATRSA